MILVATDGSDSARAAISVAIDLARECGERLLFVTVWRELRGDFGIPLGRLIPDLLEVERDWAKDTLAAAVAEAEAAGIEAESVSRHGSPVEETCAVARERRARMIVVGSHGWGTVERALLGSVSNGIVRHAPCPVLVVPVVTVSG